MSHQLRRGRSTIQVNSVSGEPYAVKAARTVREGGVDALLALGSLLHLSLGQQENISPLFREFYHGQYILNQGADMRKKHFTQSEHLLSSNEI
ncbi:hypothetical protein [Shimazuella alba]|uniref:Uncharacterized protein n=1 Tax=Shimazuella alba TaxID=2690964 RepID=A0A6I4VYB3_9BACL|nr:hypothetical protein [Shimazuella alba]MXQ53454.1 hypothetical protein [Shimazuella alba]